MKIEEAIAYRRETYALLLTEPSSQERRRFLAAERKTPKFQEAKLIYFSKARAEREARQLEQNAEAPTKTQQDIQWANSVIEDYRNLPQERRERKRQSKNLLIRATSGLLDDTERLGTAIGIWKAHEGEGDFYQQVSEKLVSDVEKGWRGITADQLAHFTAEYARKGLTAEFAGKALERYFKGPKNIKERVDAYYRFTDGLLNHDSDYAVLTEGIRIGSFETTILPRKSQLQRDVEIGEVYSMHDHSVTRKAGSAKRVMSVLLRYSNLEHQEINQKNRAAWIEMFNLRSTQEIAARELQKSVRLYGQDAVNDRIQTLNSMAGVSVDDVNQALFSGGEIPQVDFAKYRTLMQDIYNNPLSQKADKRINPKRLSKEFQELALASMEFEENERPVNVSLTIPGKPLVVDIIIPNTLHARKTELLKTIIAQTGSVDFMEDINFYTHSNGFFEGKPYFVFVRKPIEAELGTHQLELLKEFGFPLITEVEPSVQVQNEVLTEHIRQAPIRFLNQRGVRVPIEDPHLKLLGYEAVEFYKDKDDSQKTQVKLQVAGTTIAFKFDKYLNFDFEGQNCDIAAIADSLRYTMLSLLYPLLCEERIRTERGEELDLTKQFIGRSGHLRLLQPGQNHSQDQIDACLKIEQKDLITLNEERKQKLGTDRNSTYVRPTVYEDAGLPPVRIPIPLYLQYTVPETKTA